MKDLQVNYSGTWNPSDETVSSLKLNWIKLKQNQSKEWRENSSLILYLL